MLWRGLLKKEKAFRQIQRGEKEIKSAWKGSSWEINLLACHEKKMSLPNNYFKVIFMFIK